MDGAQVGRPAAYRRAEAIQMAHFVPVPAEQIEAFLRGKGFTRGVYGREVTYVRVSRRHSSVLMKVYTSVQDGQASVRKAGRDAIRVTVAFEGGGRSFGIGKFSPVLRVQSPESVLARLNERLMQAARRANEWIDQNGGAAEDAAQKAAFVEAERAQEEAAFLSGPDYRALVAEQEPGPTDDVPAFLRELC